MNRAGMKRLFTRALMPALAGFLLLGVTATAGAEPVAHPHGGFPTGFFGMSGGADLNQLPDAAFTDEMNLMQQAGVHWLRVTIPWERVHHIEAFPEKWALIDRVMTAAQSRDMQVLGIVDNPPAWAEQDIPQIPCTVQPPFNESEYATFVGELAARYPSSVLSAIEIENSPNIVGVWKHPDPCAYAQLLKQAYPAIKHANSAIEVLNGGVGGTKTDATHIAGDTFIAGLYKYGAKGSFDAVSFHPYSYPCFPSKACSLVRTWDRVPAVYQTMVANGDGTKQIWATEFGSPTNGKPGDGHVSEQDQAGIMVDAMKQWKKLPYTGPFFVFQFRDNGTNPNVKNDWFGVVSHDLTHLKPAYAAFKKLATR
jgi:polysaccharide biosynthesis protein PslG